jgi:hypothetical protein
MKDKKEKVEIELTIVVIIVGLIIISIAPTIYANLVNNWGPYFTAYAPVAAYIVQHAFSIILGLSIPVSVLLLIGIVTAVEGTKHVRRKEADMYDKKVEIAYDDNVKGDPELTRKWANVMNHVDSPNASDWRQAIIEADIILGDILTKMSYQGDSIGEQLMKANKADFNTLDQAWEAHKIRNQIAHEGSDFALSQYEAKRVVNLFAQVFKEFFYI